MSVWIVCHCVLKKLCVCVVRANGSIYSTHTYFDIFHSSRWQLEKNDLFNQTDHTHILATQTRHNTRTCVCFTLIHCTSFFKLSFATNGFNLLLTCSDTHWKNLAFKQFSQSNVAFFIVYFAVGSKPEFSSTLLFFCTYWSEIIFVSTWLPLLAL